MTTVSRPPKPSMVTVTQPQHFSQTQSLPSPQHFSVPSFIIVVSFFVQSMREINKIKNMKIYKESERAKKWNLA